MNTTRWKMQASAVALAVTTMLLSACQAPPPNKEQIGAITGGVVGGLLGSKFGGGMGRDVAIGAGVLAGAFLGSNLGRSMDQADRIRTAQVMESAPTGQVTTWRNPDTGRTYTVVPTRTYNTASGPCREFTSDVIIEGRRETMRGTACRQPDGTWKLS